MVKGMSIVALQTLFRKEYNAAVAEYANTNAWDAVADIGTEIPSTGPSEDYRWLQEMPEFDKWIGDLNAADLAEYKFSITNEPFAAAVGVHVDELDDDRDGVILTRIRSMAGGEKRKWGKLIHDLMVAGTSGLAFDGIAFFSDATGARVNDNLLAGTISAATPTLAQIAADLRTVRNAMLGFKDSRGEIVGISPDTFVVPPNLEMGFMQLMTSNSDPSLTNAGTVNPYKSWVKRIVVDPGLTDANDFYALSTQYSVGPFVKQMRSGIETFIDETGRYKNGRLAFGAKFRGNVGYGLPIMAAKVVSSVS
jgi:phage major head subunit gpT-like protein